MPELACIGCGTRFRGCPHCLTLVDIHEMFCTSCGRPLPGSLPEDEPLDSMPASQPQTNSERLTMLEIGPTATSAASGDVGTFSPDDSAASSQSMEDGTPTQSSPASAIGVVEDERDPMDILSRHDPYDPHSTSDPFGGYRNDPFTINPNVNPQYRRFLFFAHIFRLGFALALLVFFYFYLWPQLRPIAEFEVEGIGMSWYSDALGLVAIGLVLVMLVYAVSYFIIYRPFGRRNPRDGS